MLFTCFAICAMATMGTTASAQEIDWKKVDEALGRTAAVSGDVHRYGFPRTDLQVTLDGVTIRPALALGGWAAFKPMHGGAMVMGDLVLLEAGDQSGHGQADRERPRGDRGTQSRPAQQSPALLHAYRRAWRSGEVGHGDPNRFGGEQDAVDTAGAAGHAAGDRSRHRPARSDHRRQGAGQWRRLSVRGAAPRSGHRERNAAHAPGPTGVATAIGFQPTGGGKAAITGDFVLTGEEVNPVIKALRENGIEVTAVHSHMLTEQPRLIFMHFWANDDAVKLAKGLRAALDKTASAKS